LKETNPLRKMRWLFVIATAASPVAWSTGAALATAFLCNPAVAQFAAPPVSNSDSADSLIDKARMAIALGKVGEAEQLLGQASKMNPTPQSLKALETVAKTVELAKQPVTPALVKNMLEQARSAMNAGNQALALQSFARAAVDYRQAPEVRGELMETRDLLGKQVPLAQIDQTVSNYLNQLAANAAPKPVAGPTPGLMAPPSLVATQNPNASTASFSDGSAARDQVASMAAQAKLALDKGDLATARNLINQANAMKVPESSFAANQIKPWQVALELERVEKLRGQSASPQPTQVVQASSFENPAAANDPSTNPVRIGVFNPSGDNTKVAQVQGEIPVPQLGGGEAPNLAGGNGEALYRQGLDALSANDRERAISLFKQAWKFERELDVTTRAQLKDKLMLMAANSQQQPTGDAEQVPAIENVTQEQRLLQQKMFREVTGEIAEAERGVQADPMGSIDRLQMLRQRVAQSQLDGAARKQYLAMVDRVIANVQGYVDDNRSAIDLSMRNRSIEEANAKDASDRVKLDGEIENMVNEFNDLMKKSQYAEAEIVAKKVGEIDPKSTIATVLYQNAKLARRIHEEQDMRNSKDESVADAWNSVYESSEPIDDRNPYQMPKQGWESLTRMRKKYSGDGEYQMTAGEKVIREKLGDPITISFDARPITQAMQTLSSMVGIPIMVDPRGLAVEGFTSDTPVTLDLGGNPISLKSALNLMLDPLHLTYVIKDEVLQITSQQSADRGVIRKVYSVKDLILPIPNFVVDYNSGLAGALKSAYVNQGQQLLVQTQARSGLQLANNAGSQTSLDPSLGVLGQMGPGGMPGGMPGGGMPGMPGVPGAFGPGMGMGGSAPPIMGAPQGNPFSSGGAGGGLGGVSRADFTELIQLIQNTIEGRWDEGTDTIEPFPAVLSMVVSAPQETHEAIAELLQALRRLQNLQVTIEVRFITLTDNFFERLGVDFDFNVDDNVPAIPPEDGGPSATIGLNQDGTPTADLDLRFRQNSYRATLPPFGNYDPASAAQFGFAILSDLELFFLLEAAQGDSRTNVMQAPKVTMFDGQVASVLDFASRPFVISLQPIVGDFAVAQQPIIVVLNDGTQLSVQSVVSPDKRFVRMTLVPMFTRIEDADRTFTFEGTTTTKSGSNVIGTDGKPTGNKDDEETTRTGSTVQLPTLGTTSVQTTVTVPDGGTILLGGIKRLREGRTERGVPFMNKIPYVSRLFKNVGIGRETSSLMMTVTPRIIIPEEEEERALGQSVAP
jgi:general secretion pathway protein D